MSEVSLSTLDDHDGWHPRTEFELPAEALEQELEQELRRCATLFNEQGRGVTVREDARRYQLRKVFDLLGALFGETGGEEKKWERLRDWVWQPGEEGRARSSFQEAAFRFAVASWFDAPGLFFHFSQKRFGILLREKMQLRCPHCAARKRHLEARAKQCVDEAERLEYRRQAQATETTFETAQMKKQSPNRLVTEFRDTFGVTNSTMRTERAREKFRRLQAGKTSRRKK